MKGQGVGTTTTFSIAVVMLATVIFGQARESAGIDFDLEVTTSPAVVEPGEAITLEASASHPDGQPITQVRRAIVTVKDPAGQRRFRSSLEHRGGGRFDAVFTPEATAMPGTWRVTARIDLRGGRQTAGTTFTVFIPREAPEGSADGESTTRGDRP